MLNEERLAQDLKEAGLYVLAQRVHAGTLDADVLHELRGLLDGLEATIAKMRAEVARVAMEQTS